MSSSNRGPYYQRGTRADAFFGIASVFSIRKMKTRCLATVLVAGTLTACDPVYGPGLKNQTSHPVTFIAAFSGQRREIELQPGQDFVQRHANQKLEALAVIDGSEKKEFTAEEISAALSEAGSARYAKITYLGHGRILGTSSMKMSNP